MRDEVQGAFGGSFHEGSQGPANSGISDRALTERASRRSVVLKWLVLICRFGLAALFLFTAGAKLLIVNAFAVNVAELLSSASLNYHLWKWPLTIAIVSAEILAAGLLLWPGTVRLGAVVSGLLLMGFSGFALYYVYVLHGEPLECGCFGGIIASQLGLSTALRNLGLLVPVLVVFFGSKKRQR
jgi:hypothetical protein